MFKKLFGKKEEKTQAAQPEVSKGYHSCVDTCEKDIENLETECENLRKDNLTLMGKVSSLEVANKSLKDEVASLDKDVKTLRDESSEKEDRIKELEARLEEADQRTEGTPVKYASARKALTKSKLSALRKSLEAVPSGAQGFGGSCSVYDKKTKRLSLVEFKSKEEALELVAKAEKGHVDIVM